MLGSANQPNLMSFLFPAEVAASASGPNSDPPAPTLRSEPTKPERPAPEAALSPPPTLAAAPPPSTLQPEAPPRPAWWKPTLAAAAAPASASAAPASARASSSRIFADRVNLPGAISADSGSQFHLPLTKRPSWSAVAASTPLPSALSRLPRSAFPAPHPMLRQPPLGPAPRRVVPVPAPVAPSQVLTRVNKRGSSSDLASTAGGSNGAAPLPPRPVAAVRATGPEPKSLPRPAPFSGVSGAAQPPAGASKVGDGASGPVKTAPVSSGSVDGWLADEGACMFSNMQAMCICPLTLVRTIYLFLVSRCGVLLNVICNSLDGTKRNILRGFQLFQLMEFDLAALVFRGSQNICVCHHVIIASQCLYAQATGEANLSLEMALGNLSQGPSQNKNLENVHTSALTGQAQSHCVELHANALCAGLQLWRPLN